MNAPRHPLAGDREVEDGALGRGAVEGVGRDLHLAHRVALDAGRRGSLADRVGVHALMVATTARASAGAARPGDGRPRPVLRDRLEAHGPVEGLGRRRSSAAENTRASCAPRPRRSRSPAQVDGPPEPAPLVVRVGPDRLELADARVRAPPAPSRTRRASRPAPRRRGRAPPRSAASPPAWRTSRRSCATGRRPRDGPRPGPRRPPGSRHMTQAIAVGQGRQVVDRRVQAPVVVREVRLVRRDPAPRGEQPAQLGVRVHRPGLERGRRRGAVRFGDRRDRLGRPGEGRVHERGAHAGREPGALVPVDAAGRAEPAVGERRRGRRSRGGPACRSRCRARRRRSTIRGRRAVAFTNGRAWAQEAARQASIAARSAGPANGRPGSAAGRDSAATTTSMPLVRDGSPRSPARRRPARVDRLGRG